MDSDSVIARAEEALQRHGTAPRMAQKLRQRQRKVAATKAGRVLLAAGAILLAAIIWGYAVGPIGIGGLMIAVLALLVLGGFALAIPAGREATADALPQTELALLPSRTEEWLAGQRALLPAPAQRLADGIGVRLEALAPQLQGLDPREPAAAEVRRLIADELPELVKGYARVPQALRKDGVNGMSPDTQLVEGLGVVDSELARMTEQLAAGDLNKLATQGRYLELKYRGEDGGPA